MRPLKVLFAAAALLTGAHAFAAEGDDFNYQPYSRITASFASTDFDGVSANGFGIGYTYGFSLSNTLPFHLETGLNFDMRFRNNIGSFIDINDFERDLDFKAMSLSLPVTLTYNLCINAEKKIALIPMAGIDLRYNIQAETKENTRNINGIQTKYDLFDRQNGDWTHFQMGWHIGAGLQFKGFYLGARYGRDFINLAPDTKSATASISIGAMF